MEELPKNPAAVALGKLSGASLSEEEREERARNGGKASGKSLSKTERIERARNAARARWGTPPAPIPYRSTTPAKKDQPTKKKKAQNA